MSLLLLFIVGVIGISYGYVSKILEGTKQNKITAGILDLELFEGQEVIIENLYPQANEVGLIQEESFDFKLINKTENPTNYILKLQRVETPDELNLTDVVYGLTKDNVSYTGLLSELEESSYVVDSGTIKGNQIINYELRFWLREDVEDDATTNNKTLRYKLSVDVSQYLTFNDFFENKVDTKTTIDFSQISSETNGRGIYKYQEDGEDIYYWRGKVEDNHVVFAGFCWEAVRTTKTGGLKMIYDGVVGEDGSCTNTGENSQLASKSAFNSKINDNAYIGYMYGLTGITSELNGPQCIKLNSAGTSAEIGVETTKEECIKNRGKWVISAYEATHANIMSSTIKKAIDEWFVTSNLNAEEKLAKIEDTVYCNDRSIDTSVMTGLGYGNNQTAYMTDYRLLRATNIIPNLNCKQLNDRFTVSVKNGNGDLIYPVGLLTGDEIVLAGGVAETTNVDYFLYTKQSYWSMSSRHLYDGTARVFYVNNNGHLSKGYYAAYLWQVRPVISLSSNVLSTLSGTGTETDPYVVN